MGRGANDGAERGEGGAIAVGGGALAFAGKAILQRVHDQRAHQPRIAKPHLGLGGMHIGVDFLRIERHEQRHHRMAVARQIVGIGRAHRADDQLVAHRPSVDEQILSERIGAGQRRGGGKSFDHDAFALGADLDGAFAKIRAQDIAEPGQPAGEPGSAAAQVTGARSSPASVKAMSGRAIASRRTTSRIASASVRSVLRNFKRAGVA